MIKTDYYEVSLDDVMAYFAKGFVAKDGVKSANLPPEWIVDPAKNLVMFKLFIETDETTPPAPAREESTPAA